MDDDGRGRDSRRGRGSRQTIGMTEIERTDGRSFLTGSNLRSVFFHDICWATRDAYSRARYSSDDTTTRKSGGAVYGLRDCGGCSFVVVVLTLWILRVSALSLVSRFLSSDGTA